MANDRFRLFLCFCYVVHHDGTDSRPRSCTKVPGEGRTTRGRYGARAGGSRTFWSLDSKEGVQKEAKFES